MISTAQQQLDEALTEAGHSDNCPSWSGHSCAGPPVCEGAPVTDSMLAAVRGEQAAQPVCVVSELQPRQITAGEIRMGPVGPAVTLIGATAIALAEYEAAAKDLKAATEVFRRAQERFTKANQAFADAMADR